MKTTRRSFLSTSTLASAFALTPSFVRAASSANGDLRICVIGFHSRGKGLANDVLKSKGAKLVALCDVDSEVLDGFASELEKKGVKVAVCGEVGMDEWDKDARSMIGYNY